MNTTFDRLADIVSKDYPSTSERLTMDTSLQDLGIDSLGTVELLWNIEDSFKIKLPSEPVDLATLGDVVRYVDLLVVARGPAAPTLPLPAT